MSHLRPDEMIDAVEDALAPARRAHLESCAACRDQAAQLAALLAETRAVTMPEPSPLFWERLSDRVRDAVKAHPRAYPHGDRWLQWPVLAPVAGLALLLIALASAVSREPSDSQTAHVSMPSAPLAVDTATAADAAWAVVSDLVGPLDIETAQEAGIVT